MKGLKKMDVVTKDLCVCTKEGQIYMYNALIPVAVEGRDSFGNRISMGIPKNVNYLNAISMAESFLPEYIVCYSESMRNLVSVPIENVSKQLVRFAAANYL